MPTSPTLPYPWLRSKPVSMLRFISIRAEKAVASRLTSLGFTPGVDIEMTQNYGHGPLVVTIRGTRVALGRQEAKNIIR